jgi:transposase
MAEALPVALRQRVVEAYERGEGSYPTVAEKFRIGEATVRRWVSQFRDVGHVEPHPKGGGRRSDISIKELEGILDKLGDANAGEITAAYNLGRRGRERRHASSIKRALHRAGYVVKKTPEGARAAPAGRSREAKGVPANDASSAG